MVVWGALAGRGLALLLSSEGVALWPRGGSHPCLSWSAVGGQWVAAAEASRLAGVGAGPETQGCLSVGGAISLLALNGLFILIHQHNL